MTLILYNMLAGLFLSYVYNKIRGLMRAFSSGCFTTATKEKKKVCFRLQSTIVNKVQGLYFLCGKIYEVGSKK
jgi:hypothetical protein